jgi:TRAP-type C4-dicarboxylate transport system substrate-binding protein
VDQGLGRHADQARQRIKGVADGVADLAMVSTIFEAAKFPLQNVSYFTPFGSDDVGLVSKTVAELQQSVPAMADAWTKNGLTYLGGMALDSYHVWTKFPITKIEDLQGKKLSAPGPSANWVKGTGAVAVAGTLNTYYEDIKSGVSDGAWCSPPAPGPPSCTRWRPMSPR